MTPQTVNRLTASLATGMFLLLSLLLARFSDQQSRDTLRQRPSTYFTDPSGARALLLVMQQFLPATEQWRRPLNLLPLPQDPNGASTLIAAGPARPLSDSEAEHLDRWLTAGGQLILLTANGWPLRHGGAPRGADLSAAPEDRSDEADPTATFLTRHEPSLRWTKTEKLSIARGVGPSLPDAGITLAWRRSFNDTGNARIIASAGNAPIAVEILVGQGRIVAVADPTVASNGALRRSDNAVWLVGLAAGWGGSRVLFDEYHHGFGQKRSTTELTQTFFMTPWGWCVLQIVGAGFLFVFAYRRRFGRIRETPAAPRSSPLELIEARAGFLQGAGAQALAADLIVQHLCQNLGRSHGKTVDIGNLDRELKTLAEVHPTLARATALQAMFGRVRRGERLSDREFVEFGRSAGEIVADLRSASAGRREPQAQRAPAEGFKPVADVPQQDRSL